MTEGMAKSAPSINIEAISSIVPQTDNMPLSYNGIPVDMLNHFDVGFGEMTDRTRRQFIEIYEILKPNFQSMGDLMTEIRNIERKLGPTPLSETRYGKVWNWVKISRRINDLEKQRQGLGYG